MILLFSGSDYLLVSERNFHSIEYCLSWSLLLSLFIYFIYLFLTLVIITSFNASISSKVPRKFTSKAEGKMGYEDFVYFILAEEDKPSEPSLEYWYVLTSYVLIYSSQITMSEVFLFYSVGTPMKRLTRTNWQPCPCSIVQDHGTGKNWVSSKAS